MNKLDVSPYVIIVFALFFGVAGDLLVEVGDSIREFPRPTSLVEPFGLFCEILGLVIALAGLSILISSLALKKTFTK
jgi:hypothetical protein